MRAALLAVVLVPGCFPESTYDCDRDVECSIGEVCARTHECLGASAVRAVRVSWTLAGQTDVVAACESAGLASLTITYSAPDGSTLAFAPVACALGLYMIDKLPLRFDRVELSGSAADGTYYAGSVAIGNAAEVLIPL